MLDRGETEGRGARQGEIQRGGVLDRERDRMEECARGRVTEGRGV